MKKSSAYIASVALFVIVLVAVTSNVAAQKPTSAAPTSTIDLVGSIKDGKYTNGFLKFELDVPSDWIKLDDAEKEIAKKIGTEAFKTDNERTNKLLDDAVKNELVVLALGKQALGSVENSAFALGIGKQSSPLITAKMVAEATKSLFLKNPESKLIQDVKTETIGGKSFASFDIELTMFGKKIPMRYYAAMIREYSLTVSMATFDSGDLAKMEASLRTIKFLK